MQMCMCVCGYVCVCMCVLFLVSGSGAKHLIPFLAAPAACDICDVLP